MRAHARKHANPCVPVDGTEVSCVGAPRFLVGKLAVIERLKQETNKADCCRLKRDPENAVEMLQSFC